MNKKKKQLNLMLKDEIKIKKSIKKTTRVNTN
jgi:hypothetical protein